MENTIFCWIQDHRTQEENYRSYSDSIPQRSLVRISEDSGKGKSLNFPRTPFWSLPMFCSLLLLLMVDPLKVAQHPGWESVTKGFRKKIQKPGGSPAAYCSQLLVKNNKTKQTKPCTSSIIFTPQKTKENMSFIQTNKVKNSYFLISQLTSQKQFKQEENRISSR